ncbi:Mcm10-like protein [Thalictrum thalictroides]|uniref:Mcm10-like protein n=1 Tax=Thalictrum thalictroides TaxID=46969 RepID=A0A7J6VGQ7_THATH|nr:Mcm10-like protein [Thalictrum thalictroides]
MTMSSQQDDLDLLLSLQDRVLETPPASPSTLHNPQSPDNLSDHGTPRRVGKVDMSAFRDCLGDYIEDVPNVVDKKPKLNHSKKSTDVHTERFSGLRMKYLAISNEELNFAETRFIRMNAIRNLLVGDSISGSWATAGVLTEKLDPKVSSTGKKYCIWKLGCLDEKVTSVFLFGDAYSKNCNVAAGTVFALFNASVRKDNTGNGFSLSVYSSGQIAKMGTSVDYGICKAKRKDGVPCNMVINKCRGVYCNYHKPNTSQKYSVTRTELKGGNLNRAFRDNYRPEGIYMVDPLAERRNLKRQHNQPVKLLSVDGLKKALSNAATVTTNARSQGIRFLTEVTGKMFPNDSSKGSTLPNKENRSSEKRSSSSMQSAAAKVRIKQPEAKRKKTEQINQKMIELDLFSSDEE